MHWFAVMALVCCYGEDPRQTEGQHGSVLGSSNIDGNQKYMPPVAVRCHLVIFLPQIWELSSRLLSTEKFLFLRGGIKHRDESSCC